MKNVNAIIMNIKEFNELVGVISNGEARIESESGEWFFVSTELYNIDNVKRDLSNYLHVNISNIIIDLTQELNGVVLIIADQI